MRIKKEIAILLALVILFTFNSLAQGKFKAGIGYNFVSNDFEQQHLEPYTAPSVHFSYTFLRKSKFSMALESATSCTPGEDSDNGKFGFTSPLPLMLQLDVKNKNIYVGSGPAYFKQSTRHSGYNEKVSEYYLNTMVGVGIPLKEILGDFLYLELNPRISYLKSFKHEKFDVGMLSLAVFLRSK